MGRVREDCGVKTDPTSSPPVDPDLVAQAVAWVQDAGRLTLDWFRRADLNVEHKGDGTPVTAADKAAERFLRGRILAAYPLDAIVGEEEADTAGSSGNTWIIDPIDGTKAFTRGVPLYCNLLAMNDAHGPAIGVINLPAIGQTVWAGRGLGCFENGERCTVSTTATMADAYVSSSSYSHWAEPALLAVKRSGASMRTWGDGYGFALVATGRIDVMIDPEAALWDVAPMPVILHEAGGRFSDLHGQHDPSTGSGVASNGVIHEQVLGLLEGA